MMSINWVMEVVSRHEQWLMGCMVPEEWFVEINGEYVTTHT